MLFFPGKSRDVSAQLLNLASSAIFKRQCARDRVITIVSQFKDTIKNFDGNCGNLASPCPSWRLPVQVLTETAVA
jgi:hypothetical protein